MSPEKTRATMVPTTPLPANRPKAMPTNVSATMKPRMSSALRRLLLRISSNIGSGRVQNWTFGTSRDAASVSFSPGEPGANSVALWPVPPGPGPGFEILNILGLSGTYLNSQQATALDNAPNDVGVSYCDMRVVDSNGDKILDDGRTARHGRGDGDGPSDGQGLGQLDHSNGQTRATKPRHDAGARDRRRRRRDLQRCRRARVLADLGADAEDEDRGSIAREPEIIFFDEPTTGLDPIMADVINDLIVKCVADLGATAVSITHDMASARKIGHRIGMLYEGRLIWQGPVSDIDRSGNAHVDQFIHGRADGPIQMAVRRP